MRKLPLIFLLFISALAASCGRKPFIITREQAGELAIVLPDSAGSIEKFAATELQKHLELILGGKIKVVSASEASSFRKKMLVGIRNSSQSRVLKPEEAVYVVTDSEVYFFGDDFIGRKAPDSSGGEFKNKILSEALDQVYNRTGTLFAVYAFLENELGVRWLKPGDQGLFCLERERLSIPPKEVRWAPSLVQRNIRTGLFSRHEQQIYGDYAPTQFHLSETEIIHKQIDVLTWMRRMRMGRSENFRFGHTYTSYWDKYRESNPGIFALNSNGERKPMRRIERVKMCPTNTELPKLVVAEWQENIRTDPILNSKSLSGCENDSDGLGDDEWCHCDTCMAADAMEPGEKLTDYVTDRYVHLWNAILREARKYKSDAVVTGYAYENMLRPPRREKLDDGLLIEFIPRMGGDYKITKSLYEDWRKAGMTKMMYRPNDMNWEIGIPFGQEQRLFENYKLAIDNGAIGTDFDSMLGFWDGISDLTYYILARGHVDPRASFDSLEAEFLAVFGEAGPDVAKYYRHWRNIFNNKIIPAELSLNNGIDTWFLEWHRLYRLTSRIGDFYSASDFDTADRYLEDALKKNISVQARRYLERIQLVNEHSRLTFKAFLAAGTGDVKLIAENARQLVNYRISKKDSMDINWPAMFQYQYYQMDDHTGMQYLGYLPADLDPDKF